MKYKCLIFDLDGTLVNSIHALTYCTNLSLEKFGLGPLTEEQMMTIVGDGYKMQMKRSLAACGDTDEAHYEAILPVYMEIFGKYCNYEMHPYDGIVELTSKAKELGLKIAVVSNKPDAQAKKTVEYVFGAGYFDRGAGGRSEEAGPVGSVEGGEDLWRGPVRVPVFWRYEYGHEDWKEREDDDGGSSLGIQGP